MGRIGCPETSVRNYRSALRKILKERRSQRKMHYLGKITIKHVTQTQLSLINGTQHFYTLYVSIPEESSPDNSYKTRKILERVCCSCFTIRVYS
jgi:hypothetical protein